ncbi:MAG: ComEC/Rec2 family competence protein [Gemmiger sp.]|nr:ComEC/Rec2 family competence protein [Gemmiger sp.]
MGNRNPTPWRQKAGAGQKPGQNRPKPKNRALIFALLGFALAVVAAFAIHYGGGRSGLPTWDALYRLFGMAPPATGTEASGETSVTFVDVGQGDAVLVCQNGQYALLDAGDYAHADTLLATLRGMGVERLALLVMTHPHADHIGGMETLVSALPVDQVLLPDLALAGVESTQLARLLNQLEARKIPTVTAAAGDSYPVGEGSITVLFAGIDPADAGEDATVDDAVNDTSLCLMFRAGSFAFLDTGDAEQAEEAALLATGQSLRCVLYKAGHHGSATSSTAALLNAARPLAVGVSCGLDNDYGHPHAAALRRFDAVGAEVYRTDQEGSITFTPTPDGLTVQDTAAGALQPAA